MLDDLAFLEFPMQHPFHLNGSARAVPAFGIIRQADIEQAPNDVRPFQDFFRCHAMEGVVLGDIGNHLHDPDPFGIVALEAEEAIGVPRTRFPHDVFV